MAMSKKTVVRILVFVILLLVFWRRIALTGICVYFALMGNTPYTQPIHELEAKPIGESASVYDLGIACFPETFGSLKTVYRLGENMYIESEQARLHLFYTYWGIDVLTDKNGNMPLETEQDFVDLMFTCIPFQWDYSILSLTSSDLWKATISSDVRLKLTAARAVYKRRIIKEGQKASFFESPFVYGVLKEHADSMICRYTLYDKRKKVRLDILVEPLNTAITSEQHQEFIAGCRFNPDIPAYFESDIKFSLFETYMDKEHQRDYVYKVLDLSKDSAPFIIQEN